MTTTRLAVTSTAAVPAPQDGPADGWLLLIAEDPTGREIADVDRLLGLPASVSQKVHGPHLRPRLERHEQCLAVVLKAARLLEETSDVELGELVLLLGDGVAALVARETPGIVADVRAEVEGGLQAPGELLVAVLEVLLPDFDEVLGGLDDDVAEVEARVFSAERGDHTRTIYRLKRELLELRRAVGPLVDLLARLREEPACAFPEALAGRLGGQRDRAARTAEAVDHLDSLIDGVLDAQLAQIGVRQNEDQRKISAWAAIALVPTVTGAVYGMNFENMPELRWEYGYFLAIAVTLGVCLALYAGFRRNHWL